MDLVDQYEEIGKWLAEQFQVDVIVCRIYGKRWAFKWSNITDIENARRIQLTPDLGLIIPAETNDELAKRLEQKTKSQWFEL